MRVLFESAGDPTNPLSPIGFGSLLREMSLRNTSYPHMLRDTLRYFRTAPLSISPSPSRLQIVLVGQAGT